MRKGFRVKVYALGGCSVNEYELPEQKLPAHGTQYLISPGIGSLLADGAKRRIHREFATLLADQAPAVRVFLRGG